MGLGGRQSEFGEFIHPAKILRLKVWLGIISLEGFGGSQGWGLEGRLRAGQKQPGQKQGERSSP